MDITFSELMRNFLECPLVTWVKTFGPLGAGDGDKLSMYMDLVDGIFLNKIMVQIDPSPSNQRVNKNINNDALLRIQNLSILVRHIKNYYQETLQQLIVMNLPNVLTVGKDPFSEKSIEEMKKLLLLILGCAVQCERKEEFIEKIKQLEIETQAAIVSHIQEVTHNPENVFDIQWLEQPGGLPYDEMDSVCRSMMSHLRKLIDDRDDCFEHILDLTQERDYLLTQQPSSPMKNNLESLHGNISVITKDDRQHLAVELAEYKSKLRRTRQELEEKSEQLMDARNEVDRLDVEMQKLRQENTHLSADSRSMRAYRDELDSLREKASKVDRLENELTRYKEKLQDVHFYKARMEEVRDDNVTLLETKAMLEEQLTLTRSRCDKLHELEKENLQLRSKLHDLEIDRDTDKKRIEELLEENMMLEIAQKQSMNESAHLGWELEQLSKSTDVNDACKSFVFELNESASSRILKLEKENQGLQNMIQELRDASFTLEEGNLQVQQLNKKVEQLESQLDKEKQANQDMETLVEDLLKEKQQLKDTNESRQTDRDRQISELQHENEHLRQTVDSLRQRTQVSTEARVKEIEKENRILHESITDTGSKLTQLEFEKKQIQKELLLLKEKSEKSDELEREVHKLEHTNEGLQKKVAALQITCDKIKALELENSGLEIENRKLKKLVDTAQNASLKIEALEIENRQLEQENLEMRRTVETLKFANVKLSQIEAEHKELEKEKEELVRSVEILKVLSRKYEKLELTYQGLDSENQRLQQTLENSNKKMQHLEKELQDTEKENQVLQKNMEELKITSKRLEKLELDQNCLEQEVCQLEKDKKHLEKEAKRLRQQVEVKEAALDENCAKMSTLEKENKVLEKELSKFKEAHSKAKELEKEIKELQKQATIDKRTLATLREDLVHEKLRSQQQSNELEKLNHELEKIGLNKEKLLQEEHSTDDNKYRILESKIESTLKRTLEIKEEKILSLESRLEESSSLNQQLRSELTSVKRNLEALKQRKEEEEAYTPAYQQPNQQVMEKWETEHRETTMELLKVKDQVIDIEKNNAALQVEKHLLKEQLKQLDTQNHLLNSQILALQKQAASLQEHNSALQTQTAKLQVENSTLNSQTASLMAQNAMMQSQQILVENEVENVMKQKEELKISHDSLLQDHERVMVLHERQSQEYETLIDQHGNLKAAHRALEQEYRDLGERYTVLLKRKEEMEQQELAFKKESESLKMEKMKNSLLLGEKESLKEEMERLTYEHSQLQQEYGALQVHSKDLKSTLNSAQLDLNRWQALVDELKEQSQSLDITLAKRENHCELLTRLKGNLEEENHHLLSQIQMLSQQNQMLLERTMESKELFHEEQKQYIDKLNSLRRQKEKLEEKIMDQYKFYDPAPKKKNHWVGAKALVKLIKPKKDTTKEQSRSTSENPLPLQDNPDGQQLSNFNSYPAVDSPLSPQLLEHNTSPASAKAVNDSGFRLKDAGRSGGSNEGIEYQEEAIRRRRVDLGSMAYSTSAIHVSTSSPVFRSKPNLRPKGFTSDDDLCLQSTDVGFANRVHGAKGSPDYIQGRSSSLSSDEVMFGQETSTHPPTGSASKNGIKSSPGQQKHLVPTRPASPGSEMVTLEEFLQESSNKSPPCVKAGSREDLMSDYFKKITEPPLIRKSPTLKEGAIMPRGYVMPTLKGIQDDSLDARSQKPGHSVKPNVRNPTPQRVVGENTSSVQQSQTLPVRSTGGLRPTERVVQSQQLAASRSTSNSLSRAYSLASADLLRSSGPDTYRSENSPVPQTDTSQSTGVILRRPAAACRERPQSARLSGMSSPSGELQYRSFDPRRLSLAPPKSERPLSPSQQLYSSILSTNVSGDCPNAAVAPAEKFSTPSSTHYSMQHYTPPRCAQQQQVRPITQHRGEVAMVTPVRAVVSPKEEEDSGELRHRDTSGSKSLDKSLEGGGSSGGTTKEDLCASKSTPASPDPNNDPQTVWYEYGCV
ncbi:protein Daple isoform X1 [Polypterus senegalus]|uniref:protein Daple isoform X1 n=2 Tax=Polypterus senegalus TaxID=55291 RepID=UPI001962526B|nr:protein Daple isoform X1 [Polypterus senegalus]